MVKGMNRQSTKDGSGAHSHRRRNPRGVEGGEGPFGDAVRFLLVSAQRRRRSRRWRSDLEGHVWTIRTEAREKGNAGVLVLPDAAMEVLGAPGDGLVFPGRGGKQISG